MIKHIHWGWEMWAAGTHRFSLKFQSPIKPLRMDGYFTAGPPITPQPDRVQRQALVVMTTAPFMANYPAVGEVQTMRETTTPALNHTVSRHLWAVNVKQHGNEQAFLVPVAHVFPSSAPLTSELLMHCDNIGWRFINGVPIPFPDGDHVLPLDLELHVIIQYEQ